MKDLQIFNYGENEIRTVIKDGEAWFVGKDVCDVLGYEAARNALKAHVADEDKKVHRISASGQAREVIIINEAGMYSCKLESAKQFKHWVTHEVLPDIRKHGMYLTDKVLDKVRESAYFAESLKRRLLKSHGLPCKEGNYERC